MIEIRRGIFETNSSSANVLVIPKDQSTHVPHRFIFMDDETSTRPPELVLYHLFNCYNYSDSQENIDKVINFLYLNGVEEIIYGGKNINIEKSIEKYKDNPQDLGMPIYWSKDKLRCALFGNNTECIYYGDGETRCNYDEDCNKIDEDYANWYMEYYAE